MESACLAGPPSAPSRAAPTGGGGMVIEDTSKDQQPNLIHSALFATMLLMYSDLNDYNVNSFFFKEKN